jgi:hypothetical protein
MLAKDYSTHIKRHIANIEIAATLSRHSSTFGISACCAQLTIDDDEILPHRADRGRASGQCGRYEH